VGRGSAPGIVEGGVPVLGRPRRSTSDRIDSIGRTAADREYSTRWGRFHPIRRVESSRSGISPHRQQALSRSWPTAPLGQRGPPSFIATAAAAPSPRPNRAWPGTPGPVRGHDTSEALPGSSQPQPSTPFPTPNRAWPGTPAPVSEHDTRGNGGGFAPLEASCRRVAGVSRL